MCLSTTTDTAFAVLVHSGRNGVGRVRLDVDANGPNESQQFATDRGHDLLLHFPRAGSAR
jgi:hypothetical protein